MKKILFTLASIAAASLIAATFTVGLGENASPSGEVVAFEAVTASASPAIAVKCVSSVRETTNAVAQNVSTHTRYDFGLTNWNGSAYVATNSWDTFRYADWIVLGTNHIAGAVTATNVVVTNSFTIGVPGRTFFVTNTIFSASAANHYLMATNPVTRFLSGGGKIIVTGASAGDKLTLFVK